MLSAKDNFTIYQFIKYINAYTEYKLYQCYLCDKPYILNNSFNYNLKTHTNEKSLYCAYCKLTYCCKSMLIINHITFHFEELV